MNFTDFFAKTAVLGPLKIFQKSALSTVYYRFFDTLEVGKTVETTFHYRKPKKILTPISAVTTVYYRSTGFWGSEGPNL